MILLPIAVVHLPHRQHQSRVLQTARLAFNGKGKLAWLVLGHATEVASTLSLHNELVLQSGIICHRWTLLLLKLILSMEEAHEACEGRDDVLHPVVEEQWL